MQDFSRLNEAIIQSDTKLPGTSGYPHWAKYVQRVVNGNVRYLRLAGEHWVTKSISLSAIDGPHLMEGEIAYGNMLLDKLQKGFRKIASCDSHIAMFYASFVCEGRFPEGEHLFVHDPRLALYYIDRIMDNKPWPEAEPALASNGLTAYKYATTVLKKRFKRGEGSIKLLHNEWSNYLATMRTLGDPVKKS